MIFNLFKHKKKEPEPNIYEGRFITDEEISEMTKPKGDSMFKNEIDDVNNMLEKLNELMGNGRK